MTRRTVVVVIGITIWTVAAIATFLTVLYVFTMGLSAGDRIGGAKNESKGVGRRSLPVYFRVCLHPRGVRSGSLSGELRES